MVLHKLTPFSEYLLLVLFVGFMRKLVATNALASETWGFGEGKASA